MAELNALQQRFVAEYLVDLNATQAAIRAGYSQKTARAQGSRLLTNVDIAAAVQKGAEKRIQRIQVDADTVLRELLRIGTVDIGDAFDDDGKLKPIKEIPEDVRRAISGVEVDELWDVDVDEDSGRKVKVKTGFTRKVKFWDKRGSLELLGKHLKLFTDKVEHSGLPSIEEVLERSRAHG